MVPTELFLNIILFKTHQVWWTLDAFESVQYEICMEILDANHKK